jgi:hypothetical protein
VSNNPWGLPTLYARYEPTSDRMALAYARVVSPNATCVSMQTTPQIIEGDSHGATGVSRACLVEPTCMATFSGNWSGLKISRSSAVDHQGRSASAARSKAI